MDEYVFEDALTGSSVSCGYPRLDARVSFDAGQAAPKGARSLFFPGCSLINYALPLVQAVYDLLKSAGRVEGISLACCGKILSYEPDGKAVRAEFEAQLREHVRAAGVERIVAACPNCVAALRAALAVDERTAGVEVVALPAELAAMGYRIDAEAARRIVAAEVPDSAAAQGGLPALCPHDSCPDRPTGEFADGLRALLPAGVSVEAEHNRKRSFCCGSLLRAAGKYDKADEQARRHGEEAQAVRADALVTACMSCTFQLSLAQDAVPAIHYLELLFDWRINWHAADQYMKLRFLFDAGPGTLLEGGGSRTFVGLSSDEAAAAAEGEVR